MGTEAARLEGEEPQEGEEKTVLTRAGHLMEGVTLIPCRNRAESHWRRFKMQRGNGARGKHSMAVSTKLK
jgi:hypothetical protein